MHIQSFRTSRIWLSALLLAGGVAPATGWAQAETYEAVARLGGQAQALAELCTSMTKAEFDARKKEQAERMAKRGMSASRFEALFSEGYAASKAKIGAASPQQRDDACKQVRSAGTKR